MNQKKYRKEKDTLGEVMVPIDKYWGAQTERSRNNFKIGPEGSMPIEIIYAFALLKKSASIVNFKLGILSDIKKNIISKICDDILKGKFNDHFPLVIWQTGSGTHTNMNINEVISNRANFIMNKKFKKINDLIHPNDDVNMSQSSNDTFSSAMNIAAFNILKNKLIPSIKKFKKELDKKSKLFHNVVKIGRTHLMDATPITLGQEFSGYAAQIENGLNSIENTFHHLSELPIGGTAVGTGINSPKNFDIEMVKLISQLTKLSFKVSKNKFESIAAHDALVESHASIKQIAVSIIKISNDIRFLSSGPRSGIGEIYIPENEPGSSIMPGKINPTQCESIIMVCMQIIGNDTTISIAGSSGNYELNVCKPLIISKFLESAKLLADSINSFNKNCIIGIRPNHSKINFFLKNSLMLVTALNTHIGYEKSAKIARSAYINNTSLKEESIRLGYLTEDEFEKFVNPYDMV